MASLLGRVAPPSSPARRTAVALALALLLAGLTTAPPADAATITVAPGEVGISDDGQCSLREAIVNANEDAATHDDCPAGTGVDDVILPASTYTLASGSGRASPAMTVSSKIILTGAGSGASIIDGGGQVRHFEVTTSGDLTLQGLGLVNGRAPSSSFAVHQGGGSIVNRGALTILDSSFVGNTAPEGPGGAVSSLPEATVDVANSSFQDNTASDSGGAISSLGTLNVEFGTLSENGSGGSGGAILNGSTGIAAIRYSTLWANTADGGAGAISSVGTLTVFSSTLSGNVAVDSAGGGVTTGGDGTATITNSTLSGNSFSGGVIINVGTLTLTNTTLRAFSGDPPESEGPGSVVPPPGGQPAMIVNAGAALARNVILDNQDLGIFHCLGDPLGPGGNNLETGGFGACGSSAGFSSVSSSQELLLGPLQDNGGPTETHAPHPASSAVNAGHQQTCDAIGLFGPNIDQRGFDRTLGPACDIGPVEVSAFDGIAILIADVRELRLRGGTEQSLVSKLQASQKSLERGDAEPALNQLHAFGNHVEAQRGKRIAEDDADRLGTGASNVRSIAGENRPIR